MKNKTPKQAEAQLLMLHKLEQAGRFNEAVAAYQQLLSQNPAHPFLLWGLGRCMMQLGKRNSAAHLFQQAVAALPTHPQLMDDVIQRLILVGDPESALRLCEEATTRFLNRYPSLFTGWMPCACSIATRRHCYWCERY